MVLRGQFLERPTVISSGGFYLEGLSHRGEKPPALLICPPHPSRGASMDSPVCAELAFVATQRGHPTLRFNYRGAGASQGPLSDFATCVEDARAALATLRANVESPDVCLAGYDFGAEVAIELAGSENDLSGVVVIAPVSGGGYDFGKLSKLPCPGFVVVAENDALSDRLGLATACQAVGDECAVIPGADRKAVARPEALTAG